MTDKPTYEELEKRILQLEQSEKQRQKAEEKLKASRAMLYEAQRLAGLGYWSWDIASGKVVWSKKVYEIFRQDPNTFITTIDSILALSPWTEDQQRGQELIEKAVKNHETGEYDQKFLYPNGDIGYYHSTFKGIYNNKGDLISITGTVMDITKRKQAEEALKQSEERYRSLVEYSLDGYFMYEIPSGQFRFVNQRLCDMLHYSMKEALAMTIWDIIDADDHNIVRKRIRDGSHRNRPRDDSYTYNLILKDGGKIRTEMTSSLVQYRGKDVIQGVLRDVTEKEKLYRQFEQAQKMESVGRLAGGVAHDFNNMLSVILGNTEIMLLEMNQKSSFLQYLEEIHSAAQRSAELTKQLLAFARKQTIAPKVLDLNQTINQIARMIQRIIGEDIKLSLIHADSLWPVKIDPTQIDQILINLCVNARDAIKQSGTITIETSNVEVDDTYCKKHLEFRPGSWVQLSVSDDGCGIDKKNQAYIFEPFFSTKEIGQGTGLGLATVYGTVKQNNGFIYIYSEPGLGTTFKIYLPRVFESLTEEVESFAGNFPKGIETLLLVEDEASILDLGKTILERFGYTVLKASSPNEALEIARYHEHPIHLLITDVILPGMNGKELKTCLEKIKPDIKVLYMSGYTSNVIAQRGVLDENINFLQKPFSIDTLTTKVRNALDRIEQSKI